MSEPKKGRVLMVLDHPFPTDTRVENEALALVAGGYEVAVLAVGPDERPEVDVHEGIRIFRDRISRQRRNKMRGLAGTLPFLTWHVARSVRRLHSEFPFDALHMHDLYLFGGGLMAAARTGCRVVGDLHENWVEALKGYAWSTRFPGRLVVNLKKWESLEKEWTRRVDRLIVVIEEAAERNRNNGVSPDRIVVVSNTINIDSFDAYPIDEAIVSRRKSPLHVLYVGGFDLHRGLDTVVEAMPGVLEKVPEATLTLVGDGRIASDLKDAVTRLGIDRSVHFAGWQPERLLKSYITSADICLVPHRRTPHTDATIPHKLFQYMFYSKPVVVSDCAPLKRIVLEAGCGSVFKNADAIALSDRITELYAEPELMRSMGKKGRDAVISRYNWQVEAQKLVAMYDELLIGAHS